MALFCVTIFDIRPPQVGQIYDFYLGHIAFRGTGQITEITDSPGAGYHLIVDSNSEIRDANFARLSTCNEAASECHVTDNWIRSGSAVRLALPPDFRELGFHRVPVFDTDSD